VNHWAHDEVEDAARVGKPCIVLTPDEPDWAHVWGPHPTGSFQPLVDFHLTCGRGDALTVNMGGGIVRHICRPCTVEAATKEGDD
jgi:hypothetical protein